LLRSPIDVVLAYRRGAHKGTHNLLPGYSLKMSESEWINASNDNRLINDLNFFHDKWEKQSDNDNSLLIKYNEFVSHPNKIVNRIEEFWGLPITSSDYIRISKNNYSRESKVRIKTRRILMQSKNKIINILQAIGIKGIISKLLQ